jgi:hypothetical protein
MHFIHFENFYLSWILKYYLDPLSKENLNRGSFPLYFTFSEWLKTKSISFILRIFTFLESQNIIWSPFQTQIGQGFPLYLTFSEWLKKKAFHSFWAFYLSWIPKYYQDPLRSLFKKVSSRLPFKRKFGQGFPLYLTFSEWMKTRGSGEPVSLTWHK